MSTATAASSDVSRQNNHRRKRPRDNNNKHSFVQAAAAGAGLATAENSTMCHHQHDYSAAARTNSTPSRRPRATSTTPVRRRSSKMTSTTSSSFSSAGCCRSRWTNCSHRSGLLLAFGLTLLLSILRYPWLHAQMKQHDYSYMSTVSHLSAAFSSVKAKTATTYHDDEENSNSRSSLKSSNYEPSTLLQQERAKTRRARIQPPHETVRLDADILSTRPYDSLIPKTKATDNPTISSWKPTDDICGVITKQAAPISQHWSDILPLNSHSRVVITNVFSNNNLGVSLALYINQHCGVQHILPIDSLIPNHKYSRMRVLSEEYKELTQRIPLLEKLVNSLVGLQPFGGKLDRLLPSFRPTHILHLPVLYHNDGDDTSSSSSASMTTIDGKETNPRLYQRYERLSSLSHLFNAAIVGTTSNTPPHVVTLLSDSYCEKEHFVLSSYYKQNHRVSMTTLRLAPNHVVYGGVSTQRRDNNGELLIRSAAKNVLGLLGNETSSNSTDSSLLSSSNRSPSTRSLIHVDDVVRALASALQWKHDYPFVASFVIGSNNKTTTVNDLQEEMEKVVQPDNENRTMTLTQSNSKSLRGAKSHTASTTTDELVLVRDLQTTAEHLGWTVSMSAADGAKKLLAQELAMSFPYGNEVVESRLKNLVSNVTTTARSFPCASECGYQHQCTSSVFDSVAKVSRKATRGCKYAVYMVDLNAKTATLPPCAAAVSSSVYPNDDDESSLCRLAFVSAQSVLAQGLYKRTSNATKGGGDVTHLSGLYTSNGWTLYFVPGDTSTMTEEELTLPKLSPGKLFSDSVTRAMYVEPARFPLPSESVLTDTMRLIDAPARREKRKKIYRSGTTIFRFEPIPAKRARRVTLFAGPHEPPAESSIPSKTSEVSYYAGRFMKAKGIKWSSELKQQVQFYEQVVAIVQSKFRRDFFEIRYETYSDFPFQWVDSGMLMHDIREEEARLLRCEWYDEHTSWGNHGMEDLSLGYTLAKRRILEKHEQPIENQPEWTAIRTKAVDDSEPSERAIDNKYNEAEMFIRIIERPIVFPAESRQDATAAAAMREAAVDPRNRAVAAAENSRALRQEDS